MSAFNRFVRRLARAETGPFRFLKRIVWTIYYPTVPVLPRFLLGPLRLLYEFHYLVITVCRSIAILFYYNPLLQARCASFGRKVSIDGMVFVTGPVEIHVGDQVKFGGKVSIVSGSIFEKPRLIMKDRSAIGWGSLVIVSNEVILEEDVIVAPGCRISDSDGHPREADLRAAGLPPKPEDIRPIKICRNAWVGAGSYVMKGVTIGEGAIVAANSVVMSNIPPYSLAVGNPAEVLFSNYGRPSTEVRTKKKVQPPSNQGTPAA